jgi:hypothetical protein
MQYEDASGCTWLEAPNTAMPMPMNATPIAMNDEMTVCEGVERSAS